MIDQRANNKGKIKPPEPLPYVSRRALRRVKNPIPAPTSCRYCEGPVSLVKNDAVYKRTYGDWPYIYWCEPCDARVGLHPNTDIPLGTLANHALRKARINNKNVFHRVIEKLCVDRSSAYRWLANKMGIPLEQCHWGWFDEQQCEVAGNICKSFLSGNK